MLRCRDYVKRGIRSKRPAKVGTYEYTRTRWTVRKNELTCRRRRLWFSGTQYLTFLGADADARSRRCMACNWTTDGTDQTRCSSSSRMIG